MKNILLYTDTPQVGGAEVQMFLLAKFLNKELFTPILACSNYPGLDKWCGNFEKEGIKVIRINVKHKHDPRHYVTLKKIIKDEKINLLHAHIWNPASGRYAYPAANSENIPMITTEHDPFKLSPLKDFFKKRSLENVAKIVAVSKNNQKTLQKLYPKFAKKIIAIHNGIDITWWQSQFLRFNLEDYNEIKQKTFLANKDTLIIITIAELHERKGLKYLIRALPLVVKKFPNIKLVIVGEGPERKNLEALISNLDMENHVLLLGRKKEIPLLLKASNIFVLPSIREAFGIVILEAMVTSLPVIATKTGGIPEIIEHNKTGVLVEPENERALAEALKILVANPDKRILLSEEGKKSVVQNFSAQKMAEQYEKVYKTLLK